MLISPDKFEFHHQVLNPIKAIDGLHLAVNAFFEQQAWDPSDSLSKQQLKIVMAKGAVWLSQGGKTVRLRRASKMLQTNSIIHCYYDLGVLDKRPLKAQLLIDQQQYSIWYKPKGMLSQGSKWGDHTAIVRIAQLQFTPERHGYLIHRLDKATDGIMLVGHTKTATRAICRLFAQQEVRKRYIALVSGEFPDNLSVNTVIDGKQAVSHFECQSYNAKKNVSLVQVKPETGRKHQIRRHLSDQGFPIIGDRLYGNDQHNVDLQLTADQLQFICPIEQHLVSVELPKIFTSIQI